MRIAIVVTLAVLAVGATYALPRVELTEAWEAWKSQNTAVYGSRAEETRRFYIWLDNAEKVMHHNLKYEMGLTSFKVGMNRFADMTGDEFAASYLGLNQKLKVGENMQSQVRVNSAPATQDWRPKGYVTGVKDQGQCGSCWSFSATGSLEGQHFNATGDLVSLSEQQQVDCNKKCYGCNGGNVVLAYQWWINNDGATGEADYPYTAKDGTCKSGKPVRATLSDYVTLPFGNEDKLMDSCGNVGPISVAIDASHWSFQMYTSGVYYEPNCSKYMLDHAVLVVGYNSDDGDDYWIVKNSWGSSWGQDGYIWMSRNRNNNCGIASDACYPIV